jgi:CheY-like chemotaxis protein
VGREALERLEAFAPDVVVSDVMMPVMDGEQLLQSLRERPATRSIPVILMTAARGPAIDTVPVLRKPFHADALLREIQRAVQQRPS